MIDTDKYEGHTEGPWKWDNEGVLQGEESVLWVDFLEPDPDWQLNNSAIHVSEADEELMADAPLILQALIVDRAEVKRLREQLVEAKDWVWIEGGHIFETSEDRLKHYKEYIGDEEE